MPTFDDSDQGIVSDQPKSSAHQTKKAAEKSSNKQSSGIRQRPPGAQGPYRLCRYHDRTELCWQGKLCVYAHNEAERVAWEEERIKGILLKGTTGHETNKAFFFFQGNRFGIHAELMMIWTVLTLAVRRTSVTHQLS